MYTVCGAGERGLLENVRWVSGGIVVAVGRGCTRLRLGVGGKHVLYIGKLAPSPHNILFSKTIIHKTHDHLRFKTMNTHIFCPKNARTLGTQRRQPRLLVFVPRERMTS